MTYTRPDKHFCPYLAECLTYIYEPKFKIQNSKFKKN